MNKEHLVIFLILLISISCNNNLNDVKQKFGIDQNAIRKTLSLVTADSSLQLTEDISAKERRYIFINKKEAGITKPEFLRKIILLDSSCQRITIEEDYFKNPIEDKYLIVRHNYVTGETEIFLQSVIESINNRSIAQTSHQADSILASWKISENPF